MRGFVVFGRDVQASFEHRPVDGHVVGGRLLPCQVGRIQTAAVEGDRLRAVEQIAACGGREHGQRTVGADRVVAGQTGAHANRQVVYPVAVFQEVLVGQIPLDGRRREECPLVVGREVRGAVVTEYFSDLVRIAGLSHGTDVWLGNAQTLLKEGKATISTAICTRDDIMIYLIQKGLESELAFTIMEKVRKGKGLTPEWEQIMREHGVPDWYIWSCNKIQYMFPKAHAAAYVMMAWRVAYCKVFYPLAYYCAYYSIRANAFDYEKMAMGRERLEYYINDYKAKKADGTISNVEDDELKDMRIVQEMYARGFEFVPIDIYKAKARSFQIIDGKIMPSFKVISKVGESAGESIEIAARDGEFLSKDDLRQRARIGQTVIEKLGELGLLDGMAESNQLSLFDVI